MAALTPAERDWLENEHDRPYDGSWGQPVNGLSTALVRELTRDADALFEGTRAHGPVRMPLRLHLFRKRRTALRYACEAEPLVVERLENGEAMKVEVNLYATLARYLPQESKENSGVVEIAEGMTVTELMQRWGIPEDQVKLIFVNGVHAGGDTVLTDGSRLGVFPPVGGG